MATNYPGSIDSLPRPTSTTAMDASGYEGDVVIDNISDAVEAIETELGTDPAGGASTVAARIQMAQAVGGYRDVLAQVPGPDLWNAGNPSASMACASGTAYYARLHCPTAITATKLWWFQYSLAATVTTAEVGIYSAAGTKLQSASVSSAVTSEGIKSVTITSQALTADTAYYLGFFINASTAGNLGSVGLLNFTKEYLGASSSDRAAYSQSGQSALPSSVTFSGLTLINLVPFMGVSA